MSQHIISCPLCGKKHEVEGFRNGGRIITLMSIIPNGCKYETSNPATINKLVGLEYVHEQRIRNMEMPAHDEWDDDMAQTEERRTFDEINAI